MFRFIRDFVRYPFDIKKEENCFHHFLGLVLREYPAFFWEKPSIRRLLLFPFLLVDAFFATKKKKIS